MKIKKTVYAGVAFVITLIFLFAAEKSYGDDNRNSHVVTTGLSGGIINYPSGRTQTLGYIYNNRWQAEYERLGGGDRWNNVSSFSVVRRVPFGSTGLAASIGASYFDRTLAPRDKAGKPPVSDRLSYRLSIDYTWTLSSITNIRVGFVHNSTAGRSERNRGIDRLNLSFDWRV